MSKNDFGIKYDNTDLMEISLPLLCTHTHKERALASLLYYSDCADLLNQEAEKKIKECKKPKTTKEYSTLVDSVQIRRISCVIEMVQRKEARVRIIFCSSVVSGSLEAR